MSDLRTLVSSTCPVFVACSHHSYLNASFSDLLMIALIFNHYTSSLTCDRTTIGTNRFMPLCSCCDSLSISHATSSVKSCICIKIRLYMYALVWCMYPWQTYLHLVPPLLSPLSFSVPGQPSADVSPHMSLVLLKVFCVFLLWWFQVACCKASRDSLHRYWRSLNETELDVI